MFLYAFIVLRLPIVSLSTLFLSVLGCIFLKETVLIFWQNCNCLFILSWYCQVNKCVLMAYHIESTDKFNFSLIPHLIALKVTSYYSNKSGIILLSTIQFKIQTSKESNVTTLKIVMIIFIDLPIFLTRLYILQVTVEYVLVLCMVLCSLTYAASLNIWFCYLLCYDSSNQS